MAITDGDTSCRSNVEVSASVTDNPVATPRMIPAVVRNTPNMRPAPVTE